MRKQWDLNLRERISASFVGSLGGSRIRGETRANFSIQQKGNRSHRGNVVSAIEIRCTVESGIVDGDQASKSLELLGDKSVKAASCFVRIAGFSVTM